MDLSQAEAVADLIHAHSDAAHRASLQQLRGSVLRSVEVLRQQLLDSCSMIELELDFSEDHYEFKDKSELDGQMRATIARVQELASTFRHGRVMREGVRTVIAGAPNVGKSSLLNALLNEDRAIVTAIPGTTRDFIEESMNIRGIEFRLIDTAGIRETSDEVEREGVERSTSLIEHADIVLYLLDHSRPIFPTELEWIGKLHETHKEGEIILVINKKDLPSGLDAKGMAFLNSLSRLRVISTSTHSGIGLDDLKTTMIQAAGIVEHVPGDSSVIVTNSRHHNALVRASTRLEMALGSLEENRSGEFISLDLRAALDHLGEIIGVVTTDDILNSIFSRFCIGK
jgi:tRNA modification GTPase